MPKPPSHFQEEIANWLKSKGLRCEDSGGKFDNFDGIEIYNGEQLSIELILIEIGAWQKGGSLADLEKCHAYVVQVRQHLPCIILWEDFWIKSPDIVKSRLAAMLGNSQKIPARLTKARRIEKKDALDFLESNHLNGWVSAKFRYGLYLPNRYYRILNADFQVDRQSEELLVAVATFSHPRTFYQNNKTVKSYELVRFANILNSNVVGGLDKLLNVFVNDRQPDDIMTYADMEWSDGASYQKLGFQRKSNVPPIPFYLDLETMSRKSKLAAETSNEHMVVYNAGSIKYVKIFEKINPL